MMEASLQPAYVLHRRPYRDTSLLLEVFSAEHGRMGLVARGARGPRSQTRALLQPFRPLLLSWTQRGELGTLTQAEQGGAVPLLQGRALLNAYYLNELLQRLLHRHDPHLELFHDYHATLLRLQEAAAEQTALRVFERRLLEELGYGLVLDHDVRDGSAISPDGLYRYHLEQGPMRVLHGERDGIVIHGRSLQALACGELHDETCRSEVKRLMRAALGQHLGDKPLKSRELFAAQLATVKGVDHAGHGERLG